MVRGDIINPRGEYWKDGDNMEHKGTSNLREERQEREKKEKVYRDNFYKAILALETMEECDAFFQDVCTIKELSDLIRRLEVAKMLSEGVVFNDISKETGMSSTTISRVNKALNYGPGGYAMVLERLEQSGVHAAGEQQEDEKNKKTKKTSK